MFSTYQVNVPQLYADVDRTRARQLGVPVTEVFDTMQIYLGSLYVNDFNRFGRTYSVRVQADAPYRAHAEDIGLLKVRSNSGEMVPLAALTGVWLIHGDNNSFTQIGFMVLVGLAAKNAILIVEFARELEFAGRTPVQAAIEAARLRLRPILMTSIAFIMGVLPLAFSVGAGAEMRQAMGIAVFAGMIGVTAFGIFLTPVFYVLLRAISGNRPLKLHGEIPHAEAFAGSTAMAGGKLKEIE